MKESEQHVFAASHSAYDGNGDTGSSENEGDPVADPNSDPQYEEHIVSKSRQAVVIREDSTLTGLKGRQLILKDGLLEEGRTYAVAVKIYEEGKLIVLQC